MEKTTQEVNKFAAKRGVAQCSVSLTMHNLILLMISFHKTCGAISNQHCETFHQDVSIMDKRYLSKWNAGNLKRTSTHKTSKDEKSSECVIM
jgi:hypothetical protein